MANCNTPNCNGCSACGGNSSGTSLALLKFSGLTSAVAEILAVNYLADRGTNVTSSTTQMQYTSPERYRAQSLSVNLLTTVPTDVQLAVEVLKNGVAIFGVTYVAGESGVKVVRPTTPVSFTPGDELDIRTTVTGATQTQLALSAMLGIRVTP